MTTQLQSRTVWSMGALLALTLTFTACERDQDTTPAPIGGEAKIDVNGHKLQTRLAGNGTATVVLLSGAESPLRVWEQVQGQASASARVLAYDRAGYGDSDKVTGSRDGETVVNELHALLDKKGLKPPYVLVAHSLGGPFAQLFAAKYKQEIKGVVLVDCPSDEEMEFTGQIPADLFDQVFGGLQYSGTRAELKAIGQTMQQLQTRKGLPNVPLIVITNTKPEEGETDADKQRDWVAQGLWLTGKTNARQWKTEKGHEVPLKDPGLIATAIRDLTK